MHDVNNVPVIKAVNNMAGFNCLSSAIQLVLNHFSKGSTHKAPHRLIEQNWPIEKVILQSE